MKGKTAPRLMYTLMVSSVSLIRNICMHLTMDSVVRLVQLSSGGSVLDNKKQL